ncbi:MAG: helicase-related protein [Clostridia bacterium]
MDIKKKLIKVRDEYIDLIRQELVGPGSEYSVPDVEHEIITSSPEKRYSIGILFPQQNKINSENDESLRVEENADITEEIVTEDYEETKEKNSDIKHQSSGGFDTEETKEKNSDINHQPSGGYDAEADNLDEEIALAAQNLPSSFGITFLAKGNTDYIKCEISFAKYKKIELSDCKVPYSPRNPESYIVPTQLQQYFSYDLENGYLKLNSSVQKKTIHEIFESDSVAESEQDIINSCYRLSDQLRSGYIRCPQAAIVLLDFTAAEYVDKNIEIEGVNAKFTAIKRKIGNDEYSMTIMFVNLEKGKPNGSNCIFQSELSISSAANEFVFLEYANEVDFTKLDEEEQSLDLLYRNKKNYGTGLGTSIGWSIDNKGKGKIFNDFFPEVEVPSINFELNKASGLKEETLSMKYLSDLVNNPKNDIIENLKYFIDLYADWISGLKEDIEDLADRYKTRALKNIIDCDIARNRMYEGISILETDSNAWNSFILANRAMFMQREQLKMQERIRYLNNEEVENALINIDYCNAEDNHFWRPFQLAFLLMSIKSMTSDNNHDRDIVDLIWFPTGGGKTEAYLGLTAFTIFYRRISNLIVSSGTSVIMRYTLRLLATQQFTRAATLICACEFIRKDCCERNAKYKVYELGNETISIGLWIGGKHTPNTNKEAKENLNKLISSTKNNIKDYKEKYNKFQVLKCPWCGTKLVKDKEEGILVGQWGYKLRNEKCFYISCPHESCTFNKELPIQIIDEELYKKPPTLLFGTVDKFAMLTWKKDVGAFFAAGTNYRTPELIIQDELHLISGPLGTMVGLYETAVDALCTNKGVNPKIVTSTATIRRAKEQCSSLYNRQVAQFPSPGLNVEDSFFARESEINHEKGDFGRKYIGLMPSGKTKAMMEVRTIAALLQKAKSMELEDEIRDKIWTLTIYFNSLKDLGKCTTLIADDVKNFIKIMVNRLGNTKNARIITRADELTSRVSTAELNETLDKLEKLIYSKENIENKRYASNALLATNMISVGIDVARLNVMLLVGQPKLTSEYIQASSRIGRQYPGVAFALYDGSKSRDRSHYEKFRAYHESFYKYVEPTVATPFSKPARERALHAVVVAMMRHIGGLPADIDASKFVKKDYNEVIQNIQSYIISRIKSVNERANIGVEDESEEALIEIKNFFNNWEQMIINSGKENFIYGDKYIGGIPDASQGRLLKVFGSTSYDTSAFDTLTSMRNVDSSVAGNILIWED